VASQEPARISDAELRRLIEEAVDRAVAAILRAEGGVGALSQEVESRLKTRTGPADGDIAALEARLVEVERRLSQADDRHGRVESRMEEMAHHVGHREPLEVSKVPPAILERAFQNMLDDFAAQIASAKGRDEVERILDAALADVRGRSKGVELFERRGARIVINGLAASLAKKLISPKAAQVTFDEIVKHLRLQVPGYKPKPLSASVRLRAADFAVDAAVDHGGRLSAAEARIAALIEDARRIEVEAKEADERSAQSTSRSFMQAVSERRSMEEDYRSKIQSLESRAASAEAKLENVLARLEAAERYTQRVESALIRRTKEGTFKGNFTPVMDAIHEALEDGKARTVADLAKRVKGVDREVVEAVVREQLKEGVLESAKDGKVRLVR
jgi:molecular chaperone GrpE (heat shock protein)